MCGIFTYCGTTTSLDTLKQEAERIKYRGPENTHVQVLNGAGTFIFHRLAIMGVSEEGNQPMPHPFDSNIIMIANGEIFNFHELAKKYSFPLQTGSDCEVILFMYKEFGIERTLAELDGEFMFVIFDANKTSFLAARDPFGVRPGFIGSKGRDYYIASEAKSISNFCDSVRPFQPGHWWSSEQPQKFKQYFQYPTQQILHNNEEEYCSGIRYYLNRAVQKRMMAEREIGSLLSGGLDSSLITALVAKNSDGHKLNTFSIGIPGSIDLQYAQKAADHIGSIHHQIELTEKDFLDSIETVIYNIESFDTTTVRASVGNYLVAKFIRENSDCKVVFNGDGSDEACCGYLYLKNAPEPAELQLESVRLLNEIYLYDGLRSDRSISSNGLEGRVPFLDPDFVRYYLSIPPELKMFDGDQKMEKYLLRKAFDDENLLPKEVLWRRKCAFSDGVSNAGRSWHKVIQEYVDSVISDEEFSRESTKINHCPPALKESYYYRKVYQQFFGKHDNLIPHFWMPKWTNTIDPSARELSGYKE